MPPASTAADALVASSEDRGRPASRPSDRSRAPRWPSIAAALVALGLAAVAAVLLVVGHHPWDGPVIRTFSASHGLHRGDVLAALPVVVGLGLAWWCLQQGRAR